MTTQLNSSFRGTQDLPKWLSPTLLVSFFLASFGLQVLLASDSDSAEINFIPVAVFGLLSFTLALYVISRVIEGVRKATDRLVTIMVSTAFSLALIPLLSLAYTVVTKGVARFDAEFFTFSMRNVVGEGGGALHAIIGTVEITGIATLISVPIGIMAAIYLVEYGRGTVARLVTFFVDVMTGVPSIVAGLFAYALFVIFFGPGVRMGLGGAIALSLLMIPVVIRATEEMLKIVPNELREAAYALGVPKWLTVLKVVLPTSLAGIATGIMIAIARVIGETAPLLLIAGFTASMNYNPLDERMMTLPVFVYTSYANQGVDMQAYLDRAWAGALTLMLIVMVLNLVARLISKYFSPKG
ncbi:MAG: phosphate ABC transporter permease PstA [Aquiluna sp.]|jgi:phosphate transport system permease protein|nr:phosphate ABC transporter permease PstA [Aquiluna sp.]|tara:strand:- start:738 stop:1802 length:1065 start_codon:yes stop_codon:yes gene_type:complete